MALRISDMKRVYEQEVARLQAENNPCLQQLALLCGSAGSAPSGAPPPHWRIAMADAPRQGVHGQMADIEGRLRELNATVDTLNSRESKYQAQIKELQEEVATKAQEAASMIAAAQHDNDVLSESYAELFKQNADLSKR